MNIEMKVNTESFTRNLVGYNRKVRQAAVEATEEGMEFIIGSIIDRIRSSEPSGKWWVVKRYPGHKYKPPGARASAPGQPPADLTGELIDSFSYEIKYSPGQVWVMATLHNSTIYSSVLEYGGDVGWGYVAPRPYIAPVIYNRKVLQECSNIFSRNLIEAGLSKYTISAPRKVLVRPKKA